jgi:hypothetical protein
MNKETATDDYLPGAVGVPAGGSELKPEQFEAQPVAINGRPADRPWPVVISKRF